MRQLVLQLEEHGDQEGKFWQEVLAADSLMKVYEGNHEGIHENRGGLIEKRFGCSTVKGP